VDDGQEFIYRRFLAPTVGTACFAKALNRSIISSMNELIHHAKMWLTEGGLSPYDTAFRLNEIPMSPLRYRNPREAFKTLVIAERTSVDAEA
jgi:hypothetical protein